jgi:putative holin Dp-1
VTESSSNLSLSNKFYDQLKFIALVLLPAVGTLYFALSGIWGLPAAEKVLGSITAVDTFLGVILHLNNASYYKNGSNFDGTMVVNDAPEKATYSLEMSTPVEDLPGKHSIELNVQKSSQ